MTSNEVTVLVVGIILLTLWIVRNVFISNALRRQILVAPDPRIGRAHV